MPVPLVADEPLEEAEGFVVLVDELFVDGPVGFFDEVGVRVLRLLLELGLVVRLSDLDCEGASVEGREGGDHLFERESL